MHFFIISSIKSGAIVSFPDAFRRRSEPFAHLRRHKNREIEALAS